ncbi:hypothetical protein BTN49_0910 [Candidatus Enterovibrio escicola]|uniref:Uncharacterized protein n=1 Tax=Candidatus Enterovibrio escicola TaxID=1927127 RepID=A0A2A5T711_9GAMM|nr:hypothetical protein BTN49_0910 [Candidatus Enterovibrio escacola]
MICCFVLHRKKLVIFPCKEESLAEVVNIDENSVYVIHAKVLM